MKRALIVFICVLSISVQSKDDNTASDVRRLLNTGQIGDLTINDSVYIIEKKLKHKVEVFFTGDRRSGSVIGKSEDLKKLKISTFAGFPVGDLDVGYYSNPRTSVAHDRIVFISLSLSCAHVDEVKETIQMQKELSLLEKNNFWVSQLVGSKYELLGINKPPCHLHVRQK